MVNLDISAKSGLGWKGRSHWGELEVSGGNGGVDTEAYTKGSSDYMKSQNLQEKIQQ